MSRRSEVAARDNLADPRPSQVFAERLRHTRLARNLSQAKLAQLMTEAGCPMGKLAVLQIESGARRLSLDEALCFAAVLAAVPTQLLSPAGDGARVWLTANQAVDGEGMRAWLRFGASFIATGGDLPEEQVEDLRQRALVVHARALVDAQQANDQTSIKEAFQAIAATFGADVADAVRL